MAYKPTVHSIKFSNRITKMELRSSVRIGSFPGKVRLKQRSLTFDCEPELRFSYNPQKKVGDTFCLQNRAPAVKNVQLNTLRCTSLEEINQRGTSLQTMDRNCHNHSYRSECKILPLNDNIKGRYEEQRSNDFLRSSSLNRSIITNNNSQALQTTRMNILQNTVKSFIIYITIAHLTTFPANQHNSSTIISVAADEGVRPNWYEEPPDQGAVNWLKIPEDAAFDDHRYNPASAKRANTFLTNQKIPLFEKNENFQGESLPDMESVDFMKQHHHKHRRGHETEHRARLHRPHIHRNVGQRARRHNGPMYDSADRPVVKTQKGLVRGVTQKLFTDKYVDAFLGIPFAQPPVGKYRFRHPQPSKSWDGELDASRMSNSCFQINDTYFGSNYVGTSVWNANTPLSEDCLYLNIWTPFGVANLTMTSPMSNAHHRQTTKVDQLRPVLVWIFGGGFYSGTSTLALYEGGILASEEDIIVVSMNYRVAALGFLYFGRPDVPGNAGLFDQLLALQWVHDNIDQFGGDPNRVTVFGESAGAVSITYHLLSPLSRNLFQQAILQSGAATCPWGSIETSESITNGLQLASLINCPSNGSDLNAVVECLLKADPMALVSQGVGQVTNVINFPFVPVVDGSFLIEPPSESLAKSNFRRARILLGSNNDEGSAWLIYLPKFSQCPTNQPDQQQQQNQQKQTTSFVPSDVPESAELRDPAGGSIDSMDLLYTSQSLNRHQTPGPGVESPLNGANTNGSNNLNVESNNDLDSKPCIPNDTITITRDDFLQMIKEDMNPYAEHPVGKEAIVFEYSNWNDPLDPISNYDALDKIVGDYHFTCHVNEFAHRYAIADNPVYMYYFKQRKSVSAWPKWMGVLHGDEVSFVFGEPLNPIYNYTENEVRLSKRMMKYWANFAKFGNPTKTGENSSMNETWPEYSKKRQYFELHGDYTRIGRGPRAKQCAFWARHLPRLIDSYDRNQCPSGRSRPVTPRNTLFQSDKLNLCADQRMGLFSGHVPSSVIISLSVILVIAIIGLLVYAKKTGRRWRNQRAAASMNQQQQQQTVNRTNIAASTNSATSNITPNSTNAMQVNHGQASDIDNQSRGQQQIIGMQLHSMRPVGQNTSGAISKSSVETNVGLTSSTQDQLPSNEQLSALDMAQSAAARVTGSAAAAIAAARFKMLRSNTLAAAFGLPGSVTENSTSSQAGQNLGTAGAPHDLLVTRTKNERIVNTLSSRNQRLMNN